MNFYQILLLILFSIVLTFIISLAFEFYIQKYTLKREFPKSKPYIKNQSFFKRILIDFPRQLIRDRFDLDPYEFNEHGLRLFVGEQGCGKTISLVHYLMMMKKKYKMLKIRTNLSYSYQDGDIESWRTLVFSNNGIYGQIDVLDEIQNWFNSLQSKDFPVEMFQEVSQQRKQRKMILGTSQVWGRVAKPIREQVSVVYKPITLAGCLTIVRRYKPEVDDTGTIDKLKLRGMYFFVHTATIRNAFDTYKKIEVMSLQGFKDESLQTSRWGTSAGTEVQHVPSTPVPKFFSKS